MVQNYGYLRGSATINVVTNQNTVLVPFTQSFYNITDTLVINSFTLVNTTQYVGQAFNSPVVAEAGFYTVGSGGVINYIPLKTNIFLDGNEDVDILNDKLTVFIASRLGGSTVAGIYIGFTGLRYTDTSQNPQFSAPAYGIRSSYYSGATEMKLDYNLSFTDYGTVTSTTGSLFDCGVISGQWQANAVALSYNFANTFYSANAASIQLLSLFCPIQYAPNSWITSNDIGTYSFGDNPELQVTTTYGIGSTTSTLYQDIHNDNVILPISKNLVFNGPASSGTSAADTLNIVLTSPNSSYTVYSPPGSGNVNYKAYISTLVNVGS